MVILHLRESSVWIMLILLVNGHLRDEFQWLIIMSLHTCGR